MRVGVVLLGGWSAFGSGLDGGWNHPQLEQLLLPSLAADTSSSLPGSFAPQNLFKRARHSTSSNTLFTLSLQLQHFFPPLLLPTHSFLLSKKTPHGRTQTRPHHAGSSASQTMPQPTPNRNPCHALHSPVSVPTSPWLSPPPLRLDMSELLINFWGVWAPVFGFFAGETGQKPAEFQRQPLYSAFPKSGDGRTKEDITSRAANCSLAQSRMTLAYFQKLSSLVASIMCA